MFPGVGFTREKAVLVSSDSLDNSVTTHVPNLVSKPLQSCLDGEGHLVVFVDANVHGQQLMVKPGVDYRLRQSTVEPQVIHRDLTTHLLIINTVEMVPGFLCDHFFLAEEKGRRPNLWYAICL